MADCTALWLTAPPPGLATVDDDKYGRPSLYNDALSSTPNFSAVNIPKFSKINTKHTAMGNPVEEALESQNYNGLAPPPYTEEVHGSGPVTNEELPENGKQTIISSTASPYRSFPSVMDAYYQWKITKVMRTFHLGNSTDHELYAISAYSGLSGKGTGAGKPGFILHNGPSDEDQALAMVFDQEMYGPGSLNSVVTLPPLLSWSSSPEQATTKTTEIMRTELMSESDLNTVALRFSIEVDQRHSKEAGKASREAFEWRPLSKDEIDSEFHHGFKLIQVHQYSNRASGGSAAVKGGEESGSSVISDGSEVVAIAMWKRFWSIKSPFRLQLIGSGQTGQLGDRWLIMAVITGVRVWSLDINGRTSARIVKDGGVPRVQVLVI